jgi:hypothetical protein
LRRTASIRPSASTALLVVVVASWLTCMWVGHRHAIVDGDAQRLRLVALCSDADQLLAEYAKMDRERAPSPPSVGTASAANDERGSDVHPALPSTTAAAAGTTTAAVTAAAAGAAPISTERPDASPPQSPTGAARSDAATIP